MSIGEWAWLLAVPLVISQAVLYARYRDEWAARGMVVSTRFLTAAAVVGVVAGGLTFAVAGLGPAVAAAVGVPYFLLAAFTDWRVFLIPREASTFPVVVGVALLALTLAGAGASGAPLSVTSAPFPTLIAAIAVGLVFAVLGLFTSALGMGDVRLLGVAVATMWWLPPLLWVGAVLVAISVLFPLLLLLRPHRTASGKRATCLGPAFAAAFIGAALVPAFAL